MSFESCVDATVRAVVYLVFQYPYSVVIGIFENRGGSFVIFREGEIAFRRIEFHPH